METGKLRSWEDEKKQKKSNPLGKYKLGKELDDIDIRNFAYEEN